MNFPEKLKRLRKEKGMTQEELAEKIYVSRTLISKYENGAVYPTEENIEKLALFFGVKISDLIDNEDTVQLVLKEKDLADKINSVLSRIIISLSTLASVLSFIPMLRLRFYDYSNGTPPTLKEVIMSPMHLSIIRNNPIVVITVLSLLANAVLSALLLRRKNNAWLKLSNYIAFVINLFLLFFAVVFTIIYISNNSIDY